MAHLTNSVSRNNASVLSKIAEKNLPILSNFMWHVPLRIIAVNSVNATSSKHNCKLLSSNSFTKSFLISSNCQWYNEKCNVSRRQSDYPDTTRWTAQRTFALRVASWVPVSGGKFNVEFMGNVNNDRVAGAEIFPPLANKQNWIWLVEFATLLIFAPIPFTYKGQSLWSLGTDLHLPFSNWKSMCWNFELCYSWSIFVVFYITNLLFLLKVILHTTV